jgi:hypothetical protein
VTNLDVERNIFVKAQNKRIKRERDKEPYIIGSYEKKIIMMNEILQAKSLKDKITYGIYRSYVSVKKEVIIIKDRKKDNDHD